MEHSELLQAYRAGIEALNRAVRGLTPEHCRARPVPDQWTIQEIVCHLADSEALFADRMKRVLAEDRPQFQFANPARYVAALCYDKRDVVEEAAFLGAIRQQMVRILEDQPVEAWHRIGIHSKAGEQTLEQLLRKAIDHLQHHLGFLRSKRELLEKEPWPIGTDEASHTAQNSGASLSIPVLEEGDFGSYGSLAGHLLPEGLVVLFVPSLAALLTRAEELKGVPLTEAQVCAIRDGAQVVVSRADVAAEMVAQRGYDEVDPLRAWESWQAIRSGSA